MSNPYQSPSHTSHSDSALEDVKGPAIALMVVASIAIAGGVLGLAGDVFLVLSGAVDRLEAMNDGPISEYTQITIRTVWGILLLIASSFVFYGAMSMKNLTNLGMARGASIVAMIPLVGPCCILGIPFGLWAFVVLGKPHVRDAFQ